MSRHPRLYNVPEDLRDRLLDFTIAYLLERPRDLPNFGMSFFQRLKDNEDGVEPTTDETSTSVHPNHSATTTTAHAVHKGESNRTRIQFPEDDNTEDEIDEAAIRQSRNNSLRRKSVFAEQYNPEEDTDETPIVHPKSPEQRVALQETVKHILLFRALDEKQISQVIDAMFEKSVQKNEFIIKQGDDGDNFYVIQSGKFKVLIQHEGESSPKEVARYHDGGYFGELALMYNAPRAATVQADSPGTLWALDRVTFRRVVLKNAYKKRKMYEEFLQNVPLFQAMDTYEKMNVADALIPREAHDGEVIIKQGDTADGMYFVETGTVTVHRKDSKGHDKEIVKVTKGGYFGELSLITEKPRAATVIAVGPVKLAFLDVEAFERLLGPCLSIMKRNAEAYEKQLTKLFGPDAQLTDIRWN